MLTLLSNDKIKSAKWMSQNERNQINSITGIEFILNLLESRIGIGKDPKPKIKPCGVGSRVLIIHAGTGSGKTALVPPNIYKRFFDKYKRNIICTEPTRATTMMKPAEISKYDKTFLVGQNIGFQTKLISRKPIKGILFCTVGILLQYLKIIPDEEFIKRFGFILLDEIHIRSIDADMILYNLKQFLMRNWDNPNCPQLILMS